MYETIICYDYFYEESNKKQKNAVQRAGGGGGATFSTSPQDLPLGTGELMLEGNCI